MTPLSGTPPPLALIGEYDAAAEWCAVRGLAGKQGDPLPDLLSVRCAEAIDADLEAFAERVQDFAYMFACVETSQSDEERNWFLADLDAMRDRAHRLTVLEEEARRE